MGRATCVLWLAVLGGCEVPAATPTDAQPAPLAGSYALAALVGDWRWILRTSETGSTRVEDETWRFAPGDTARQLRGRYLRTVEVRSDDGVPFQCNQRPWYRQRAVFDVVVELAPGGLTVRETAYRAEPGPCDRGFRHLGAYAAVLDGLRLRLRWADGEQALLRTDDVPRPLAEQPWPASPVHGAWRWDATSVDADGNLRDETEWWELAPRADGRLDATYRRRVTLRSPDGSPLACAGAPTWSYDDAYVLEGQREAERWHLYERAGDPGDHPCLRMTAQRALDDATAEQLGDYLILEWRGKRRQVLYRPA